MIPTIAIKAARFGAAFFFPKPLAGLADPATFAKTSLGRRQHRRIDGVG
jgi:hypothetical protein